MLKRTLVDAHVVIEPNLGYFYSKRSMEEYAKRLESEARDILTFLKDHRSMDINDCFVVREYAHKCEHCGWTFETENKEPDCCESAIREWATMLQLIEFGYEEPNQYV